MEYSSECNFWLNRLICQIGDNYFLGGIEYKNIHLLLSYMEYDLIFDLEDTSEPVLKPQIVNIIVKMLINGFPLYNTLYSSFIDFICHIK